MAAIQPTFAKQPGGAGGTDKNTLTDAEYAQLQLMLPYAGKQPLTTTTIELITDTKGNILYGVEV